MVSSKRVCVNGSMLSHCSTVVFAPIGGFQAVTEALRRLAESLGVTIECNTMVTSIHEDGVLAIDTSSPEGTPKFLPADLIVVNADLPYATKSLVRSESLHPVYDWDDQFSFSSGVISFHWSVAKPLHDLNTHNVFLIAGSQAQAERSWDILRTNEGETQGPFNFYVHRAGKTDPSAAPEGSDSIMVLVPCRTLLRDEECAKLPREQALHRYREQFCESTIQKVREAVLERLGVVPSLQDLKDEILDEVVDTPATWAEQFHLAAGTPFALASTRKRKNNLSELSFILTIQFALFFLQSHGFAQLSLARPSHYCREIPNVLFCGASTRPGNGVPLVLIGAKQVSEKAVRILEGKLS